MKWGLIPSWAPNPLIAAQMINARSETASTKPAFRDALKSRRCLIPADGFYEWVRTGKAKQPYCFEVNDGELFAFAGLWDRWKNPSGNWVSTCSVLTTTPNAVTSPVHDRMPGIRKEPVESWEHILTSVDGSRHHRSGPDRRSHARRATVVVLQPSL
jgi:putative SOS response-associated peptidase YedK